ncbi:nischarin-like, partial [Limulus polyphemus]|uniref:Nischarin-like n=1 Tax=Limulus polyphemus TaxID=6850 RepID=A0ABM1BZB9_LIMPO
MALYWPVTTWMKAAETCRIVKAENSDGFTLYVIVMYLPSYSWTIKRRYSEFHDLQEKLVAHWNVEKSLLPPKKLFGNQSEAFIQQRQIDLEVYLQTLIHQFSILPPPLISFLDFHKYEIRTIAEDLAETFFYLGDELLTSGKKYKLCPLQLHALTERLKLAEPPCSSGDKKRDIGHLLEFVSQLHHLKVLGSNDPVGQSNIIPNQLTFDISPFKSLEILEMEGCEVAEHVTTGSSLRESLVTIKIHQSLDSLASFLLCDDVHWSVTENLSTWPVWQCVQEVDLSHNNITAIDSSVKLLFAVETLNLSHNQISAIENLESLPHLSLLDLSHNKICEVVNLHTKLGNIRTMKLHHNSIKSVQGFARLYSVVELDLTHNKIASVAEVGYLGALPCLEILDLAGNPVANAVDFRPQALAAFDTRAAEV